MAFSLDLGNLVVHLNMQSQQFDRMLRQAQGHLKTAEQSMTALGRKMTLGLTVPLTALGVAAVKSFSKSQDAFIGVQKTVNATDEQLQSLKHGFQDMSKEIPIATTELYGIGEAAGQLGIQTKNILGFTKVMAELGVTTNLSSEEAASALARLANITQMSQDDFDRLGSTIVDLGNNLATTESEIVNMALRLAGAGTQIGLTEAQILSLAGALSSVGIRAELGGGAFSRIMLTMNTAVKNNTAELRTFANVADMSQQAFANLFSTDSQKALEQFVLGLAKLRDRGRDLTPIMESIGLGGLRIIDVLGRMSGASDVFTRSFNIGENAWKKNTASIKEAEKRFSSFSSHLQIVKNELMLVAGEIGESLIPYLEDLQNAIRDGLEYWEQLSDHTKSLAIHVGLIAAVAGPTTFAMGQLAKAARGLLKAFTAFKAMAISFGASLSAIGVGVLAIVGLAYTLRAAWNQGVEGVRKELEALQNYFADAFEWIRNTALGRFFDSAFDGFIKFFKDVRREFGTFIADLSGVGNVFAKQILRYLRGQPTKKGQYAVDFVEGYEAAIKAMEDFGSHIEDKLTYMRKTIVPATGLGLKEYFSDIGKAVKAQLKQDFDNIISSMESRFPQLKKLLEGFKLDLSIDVEEPEDIAKKLQDTTNQYKVSLKEAQEQTTEYMDGLVERVRRGFSRMVEASNAAIKQTSTRIKDLFVQNSLIGKEFMDSMTSSIENGLMDMAQDFDNFGDHVKQIFKEIYYEAIRIAFIRPIAESTAGLFMNIGSSILGGATGAVAKGTTAATTSKMTVTQETPMYPGSGPFAPLPTRHSGQNLNPDELVVKMPMSLPTKHSGYNLGADELAVKIKKNELVAPEGRSVDASSLQGFGGVQINFTNPPNVPLGVKEQSSQQVDGRQVVSIILEALDTNMTLRRKTKAVARI